jgi:hypothetical protein
LRVACSLRALEPDHVARSSFGPRIRSHDIHRSLAMRRGRQAGSKRRPVSGKTARPSFGGDGDIPSRIPLREGGGKNSFLL